MQGKQVLARFIKIQKKSKAIHHRLLYVLKGYCHGDFVVFWSKQLKYLTKNVFSNMKLFLEHWGENTKGFLRERTNYNQFLATSLQYTGRT